MFRFSKISSRKTKKHSIHWTWGQVSCNSYTLWKLSIQKKNIINPIHLSFQNFLLEKQINKIKKSPEFFLLKCFFLCQSRYWHMQICISTHCSCSVSPNVNANKSISDWQCEGLGFFYYFYSQIAQVTVNPGDRREQRWGAKQTHTKKKKWVQTTCDGGWRDMKRIIWIWSSTDCRVYAEYVCSEKASLAVKLRLADKWQCPQHHLAADAEHLAIISVC